MEEQESREVKVFLKVTWKEPIDRDRTPSIYPGCTGLNGTLLLEKQKFSGQQGLFEGKEP